MASKKNDAIASGAQHVEETRHLETGNLEAGLGNSYTQSAHPQEPHQNGIEDGPIDTELKDVTLSMFRTGDQIRVRVGSPFNPASSFEGVFESAEEANTALLDAGVLEPKQVPKPTEMVGTGIALSSTTAEKLVEAGLKRHHVASM